MNNVIAIHSPGGMGSAIAARLVAHGARMLTSLDGRSGATIERARNAGWKMSLPKRLPPQILSCRSYRPASCSSRQGVSETPVKAATSRFLSIAMPYPKTKGGVAATLAETGCDLIGGAIVGAPPQPGEKGPSLFGLKLRWLRAHPDDLLTEVRAP
jgi:hypothetical protein